MSDAEFGALVSAKHRKVEGRGKADIGGRLRVATILRNAGIVSSAAPERIAGSTNEVWRAGEFVIRVGSVPGAKRLRREALLVNYLPWGVNYPTVVACGVEPFGEWLIVRNRSGLPFSEAWSSMDRPTRRRIVHELGRAVKEIHETKLASETIDELAFDPTSAFSIPHMLPASRLVDSLQKSRDLPWMDVGLVDALIEKTREVADAFKGSGSFGLVHGDLHFENVLVRDGNLTSVLDFEWCRPGPGEIDLDVLARFCEHPDLTVGGASKVDRDSYRPVLGWLNEGYPELFLAPNLRERLMLCALAAEVPWLSAMPPTGPASQLPAFHPVNRLRELLDSGTSAERLGWVATGI